MEITMSWYASQNFMYERKNEFLDIALNGFKY